MQPARAAHVLVIASLAGSLLATACAPQSVTREIAVLDDAGPLPEGPRPPDARPPGMDGAARPAGVVDARVPDTRPLPVDAALRPPDTGPFPPDAGVLIDPPPAAVRDAGVEPAAGPIALLVVGSIMPVGADDERLRLRLEGHGLTVRLALDTEPISMASGARLVVISGSSLSANLGARYTALPLPVLCLEPAVMGTMRLTGTGDEGHGNATGTQITITAPDHPIAAGQMGTVAVTAGAANFGWGLPAETAARIATVAGMANRYAVFAYERGAMLAGMPALPAPARRAGLFVHTMVADRLTPAGWQIFDAAVSWTLGR